MGVSALAVSMLLVFAGLSFGYTEISYTSEPEPLFTPYEKPQDSPDGVLIEEQGKCTSIYDYGCSCMVGLRNEGYAVEGMNAEDLHSNSEVGYTNDIILFKYWNGEEWIYHAGTIRVTFPSGLMRIYECNYKAGVCEERDVLKSDPAIRGYIHKN